MAAGSDVRDILELESSSDKPEFMTKESLLKANKKPQKKSEMTFKRPEGMHRELWGLLWTDNKDAPPIMPSDSNQGYKQMKAKIGRSRVRPWKWMPFTNPARKDGAIFYHWRRAADEGKDYPFARFNKTVDVPTYSDLEYQQHLHDDNWTRQETDHLVELCKRFDLRFLNIHDRWDRDKYQARSVEDIKERYYNICNLLAKELYDPSYKGVLYVGEYAKYSPKVRAPQGQEPKIRVYDADHERKRKTQLEKLFNRTPEEVEEEEYLIQELKKIELRKKEREKKTQDLQKLITAADSNSEIRKGDRKTIKKKLPPTQKIREPSKTTPDTTGIKFPDPKQSGVSLRSHRMKLPASVGQKKTKAIEQVLEELGIEYNPMPTDEIVSNFNELRQDIVLLYELKLALANCEYELQTLKHRHETLAPGKTPDITIKTEPEEMITVTPMTPDPATGDSPSKVKKLSEAIDVVGSPGTPNRKRKAAIEQSNIMKKIKQKV